jgi:hypothetical protein
MINLLPTVGQIDQIFILTCVITSGKYQLKTKRVWRKIHLAVDHHHLIQCSGLSQRHIQVKRAVKKMVPPIKGKVRPFSADGA